MSAPTLAEAIEWGEACTGKRLFASHADAYIRLLIEAAKDGERYRALEHAGPRVLLSDDGFAKARTVYYEPLTPEAER